jgi:hypothetical protein
VPHRPSPNGSPNVSASSGILLEEGAGPVGAARDCMLPSPLLATLTGRSSPSGSEDESPPSPSTMAGRRSGGPWGIMAGRRSGGPWGSDGDDVAAHPDLALYFRLLGQICEAQYSGPYKHTLGTHPIVRTGLHGCWCLASEGHSQKSISGTLGPVAVQRMPFVMA